MPWPELTAIIAAAGKGERFGGPKAEAVLENSTFLDRVRTTLGAAGVSEVYVAQGIDTPDMLATLRHAVRELASPLITGYLIIPVDHPFVRPETVTSLCAAWSSNPDAVYRPSYQGRSGHPVIIPAWLDLNADAGGQGLAGIIRAQACSVIDVPVDDPEILRNVNYPKDLED